MKNEDMYANRNVVSRKKTGERAKDIRFMVPEPRYFCCDSPAGIINRVSGSVYRLLNHHFSGSGKSICDSSGFPLSRLPRE